MMSAFDGWKAGSQPPPAPLRGPARPRPPQRVQVVSEVEWERAVNYWEQFDDGTYADESTGILQDDIDGDE